MNKTLDYVVCNLCGNKSFKIIHRNNPYQVVSCCKCNLFYLNPRPTKKDIYSFYQNNYFHSGLNSTGYSNYSILDKDLKLEAEKKLKIIKQFIKNGRLLDIGCGYGHFLMSARNDGYKVEGFDISKDAINKLISHGIKGKVGKSINSLPNEYFDIITAWDVVEHFTDPKTSFQAISKLQRANSYLFITTPNINNWNAKIFGKYWYGYKRIPEHLFFYSEKHIKVFLEKSGYNVVRILNWGFYRNIGYCVDQTARYNKNLHVLLNKLVKFFNLQNKTLFFPIIDMLVIARKK